MRFVIWNTLGDQRSSIKTGRILLAIKEERLPFTLLKMVSEGICALLDVTVKVGRAKRSKAAYETQTITQTLSHKIISPYGEAEVVSLVLIGALIAIVPTGPPRWALNGWSWHATQVATQPSVVYTLLPSARSDNDTAVSAPEVTETPRAATDLHRPTLPLSCTAHTKLCTEKCARPWFLSLFRD